MVGVRRYPTAIYQRRTSSLLSSRECATVLRWRKVLPVNYHMVHVLSFKEAVRVTISIRTGICRSLP
jgi:hypothetical protein